MSDKPKLLLPKGMTVEPEWGLSVPAWITEQDMDDIRTFADMKGRGKLVSELREIARVFLYTETNSTAEKAAYYAFKSKHQLWKASHDNQEASAISNSSS